MTAVDCPFNVYLCNTHQKFLLVITGRTGNNPVQNKTLPHASLTR